MSQVLMLRRGGLAALLQTSTVDVYYHWCCTAGSYNRRGKKINDCLFKEFYLCCYLDLLRNRCIQCTSKPTEKVHIHVYNCS